MKFYKILYYPDKRLRKIARSVINIDIETKKTIVKMFNTMKINNGIGLAATQVNINKKIIVIYYKKKKIVLINPKILEKKDYIINKECCLSIPNFFLKIKRYNKIIVSTLNFNKKKIILKIKGYLSICIQHELDHLIGKLIIDYK